MIPLETTKIAGQKTVEDWQTLKGKLDGGDAPPWKEAFEEFFYERLKTRYFTPIEKLEEIQDNNGEGFSIVVIQCSLIEFLASVVKGKTYRHRWKTDPPLDKKNRILGKPPHVPLLLARARSFQGNVFRRRCRGQILL